MHVLDAIGNTSLKITDDFELGGIALGTIVALAAYHIARMVAPANLREDGALIVASPPGAQAETEIPGHDSGGSHRSS